MCSAHLTEVNGLTGDFSVKTSYEADMLSFNIIAEPRKLKILLKLNSFI